METEIIADKEPRFLSKFEEESLDNYFHNELDFEDKKQGNFKDWYENLSWIEIDEIVAHYKKENE